ncbi:hypothetical protein DNTS_026411, partial [Danionella cerebrum]
MTERVELYDAWEFAGDTLCGEGGRDLRLDEDLVIALPLGDAESGLNLSTMIFYWPLMNLCQFLSPPPIPCSRMGGEGGGGYWSGCAWGWGVAPLPFPGGSTVVPEAGAYHWGTVRVVVLVGWACHGHPVLLGGACLAVTGLSVLPICVEFRMDPDWNRSRSSHRSKHTEEPDGSKGTRAHAQYSDDLRDVSPAAERLRHILSDDDEPTPTLFTEMDTLQQEGGEMEWKESARWVKFEEKVEEGGERWSKPHVSTLTLHSLFELRTCFQTGSVLLELQGQTLSQITDAIIDQQIQAGLVSPELREKISFVLLRKHRHQTKKPIHRSFADIGKTSPSNRDTGSNPGSKTMLHHSSEDLRATQSGKLSKLHSSQCRSMNDISIAPSSDQLKNKFMKKIPQDAEASNVLIGEVDFLDKPFVAFVRLAEAATLGGLTEVPVPTRFIFVLLGPGGKTKSYNEIGRAMATLMVDDLFSDVAYKARDREDLIAGLDEFLDEVIVLPPGEWDPKIRIEPPKKVPSAEMRKSVFSLNELVQTNGNAGGSGVAAEDEDMPAPHQLGEELSFTGRDFSEGFHIQSVSAVLFIYLGCITNAITFGGLLGDATQNYQGVMESFLGTALAGAVFCLFGGQPLIILSSTGPILIFEKLLYEFSVYIIRYMTRFTEEGFSSLISFIFISDALKKMLSTFSYFPIDRYFSPESITTYRCDCLPPDQVSSLNSSSALVLENITDVSDYPMFSGWMDLDWFTLTFFSLSQLNFSSLEWARLGRSECLYFGGALVGRSCRFVPDLGLLSFILFFGTYSMTITLKKFKTSRYFPTKCRTLVADFAIIISILFFCALDYGMSLETPKLHVPTQIKLRKLISDFSIFTSIMIFVGLDMFMGLKTPKLIVPTEFKPTRPDRGWLILPEGRLPWWICACSFVPALLVTILIFMDQQITAVIVNRKENKLKKGCGYHLDLMWVGLLMAVCSFMGLPWYVAATVISIAHIDSLKMESESSAPGEQPQFLGVREQRLTGILVFILTGVSVFLAPVLKFIPMPVLYGVFLYMGVASLHGIQFWERLKLFLMPAKHQPDFVFLRHVPLRRVHLFTLVQMLCLGLLWVLKSTGAAIVFPVMILGLMLVRKILDFIFSQHDLAWLDDILPEKEKKKREDEKKKKKKTEKKKDKKTNAEKEKNNSDE